jgi:cytochrome c oxidase cbb3-type subunit 4
MDINDLRTITTLLLLFAFLGIVGWTYSAKRKATFEEAGRLPLEDEPEAGGRDAAHKHN